MSRQTPANACWIQPSFDDFLASSMTNVTGAKKNSSSTSRTASSSSSSSLIAGGRKTIQRDASSNGLAKPSTSSLFTVATNGPQPSFKRKKVLPVRRRSTVSQHPEYQSLLDKYAPASFAELALHPRKLKELRDWFEKCTATAARGGVSFLLVSGPSGCGKLSAVRVIGKEYCPDVSEWTEPLHWREWKNYKSEQQVGQLEIIRAPQLDEFSSFLLRTSCVSTLDVNGMLIGDRSTGQASDQVKTATQFGRKLIIVKDLPNEFYDKAAEFANVLKGYAWKASKAVHVLVVFIVSTSGGSGTQSQRLFSTELLEQLRFDVIEFNPIANTFLSKTLKRIIECEHMDIGKAQLDQLIETANGDIRFAVNELQFLHSGHGLQRTTSRASGRDSTLLLFRALGRCIYSKRNEDVVDLSNGEDLLPTHLRSSCSRPYPLDFDPDLIVEQTGFQPSMFALFLEENVWNVFTPPMRPESGESNGLEALAGMLEMFSFADIMANPRDYEAREKLSAYEKSLPARAVAFYAYENAVQKKGRYSYKSMRRPIWLDTSRKLRVLEGKHKQPTIYTKDGSVSVSEYVPFARKVDRPSFRVSSKPQHSSEAGMAIDGGSAPLMEAAELDDYISQFVGNTDQGDTGLGSCNYTMHEGEIASVSIDEFEV